MAEQKAVYTYDDNNHFTGTKLVADDYEINGNETFTAVPDGQYQPSTWNGTEWIGTPQADWEAQQKAEREAYLAEHPEEAPQPSATDQALAQLALQVAQSQVTQDTVNSQLLLAQATTAINAGGTN
ncbi:hypothetical protein [Paucilactobacillus sp. N302-9]